MTALLLFTGALTVSVRLAHMLREDRLAEILRTRCRQVGHEVQDGR
jgi:hypothetical protein